MLNFRKTLRFSHERPLGPAVMLIALRALSLYFLVDGLSAWHVLLDGQSEAMPFNAMPLQWQISTVYCAILALIAAIGLWCGAGWGVAAWLFVAVTEIVMHVGFQDLFGENWNLVTFHGVCIVIYILLARWAGAPENTTVRFSIPDD